jgi:hypothetical protein
MPRTNVRPPSARFRLSWRAPYAAQAAGLQRGFRSRRVIFWAGRASETAPTGWRLARALSACLAWRNER